MTIKAYQAAIQYFWRHPPKPQHPQQQHIRQSKPQNMERKKAHNTSTISNIKHSSIVLTATAPNAIAPTTTTTSTETAAKALKTTEVIKTAQSQQQQQHSKQEYFQGRESKKVRLASFMAALWPGFVSFGLQLFENSLTKAMTDAR